MVCEALDERWAGRNVLGLGLLAGLGLGSPSNYQSHPESFGRPDALAPQRCSQLR